jgi:hypothetical protein
LWFIRVGLTLCGWPFDQWPTGMSLEHLSARQQPMAADPSLQQPSRFNAGRRHASIPFFVNAGFA